MSELENRKAFAYLLVASEWSSEIEAQMSDCTCSDALELFLSREEQAEAPDNLWGFGWDAWMSRIAPVQLTHGWDPRPYLLAVFGTAGVEPRFMRDSDGGAESVFYFDRVPSELQPADLPEGAAAYPSDRTRFDEVLTSTVELARTVDRGVLFLGAWGFDYDADADYVKENEIILRQAGMKFITRHA